MYVNASASKWLCKLRVCIVENNACEDGNARKKASMLYTLLNGGLRLRSNTKRMMHTSLPSYQLPPSLIWQSHAEDQMCLRAALFSLPIMSAYVSASDTCTPSLEPLFFTLHLFSPSQLPIATSQIPPSTSTLPHYYYSFYLNLLYCSFSKLLFMHGAVSASGM